MTHKKVNNQIKIIYFLIAFLAVGLLNATSWAATTINATNKYAYGANIGWINSQGDISNGLVITPSFCTGFLWSANSGWINMGNTPTNGNDYSNTSANDFGVNVFLQGFTAKLQGYPWSPLGWMNWGMNYTDSNDVPCVDLNTGIMSGSVWIPNAGWMSVSNLEAYVQTDSILLIDNDADGIPDFYEYQDQGNFTNLASGQDFDSDGVLDEDEALAGTSSSSSNDFLRITQY
ncbi:MAG: hypothetical protein GKR87_03895 [Kiritimatiellae bacterium]|nr:hypothetical protein [Kiritimatiellia bacterium]